MLDVLMLDLKNKSVDKWVPLRKYFLHQWVDELL